MHNTKHQKWTLLTWHKERVSQTEQAGVLICHFSSAIKKQDIKNKVFTQEQHLSLIKTNHLKVVSSLGQIIWQKDRKKYNHPKRKNPKKKSQTGR